MLLIEPSRKDNLPTKIKSYSIKPGSVLDAPKYVMLSGSRFSDQFYNYLTEKATDTDVIISFLPIYSIYKKDGAVNITSCQHRHLKGHHERVLVEFLRENLKHLAHLDTYL